MTKDQLDVEELGRKHKNSFIKGHLNTKDNKFRDSVLQLKLKTFLQLKRKKKCKREDERSLVTTVAQHLFVRLVIVSKSRDINLRNTMTYELSTFLFFTFRWDFETEYQDSLVSSS